MKKRKTYRAPDLYVKKLTHFHLLQSGSTEDIHDGGELFDTDGSYGGSTDDLEEGEELWP